MIEFMIKKLLAKRIVPSVVLILTTLSLAACSLPGGISRPSHTGGSSDEMFNKYVPDATVNIFVFEDRTFTVDNFYEVNTYSDPPLVDGGFYRLKADVNYLNGGVAGYVNYPEIKSISACEEISPFDLRLPDITEKRYGLIFIGDYADGDIFLNEYGMTAVWKDGSWVYRYNKEIKKDDGSIIYYRDGVSEDTISQGIESGILSCEDYFVVPAQNSSASPSDDSGLTD